MSNCLDPDQARHSGGPDLGTNYLQGHQQMTLVGKELYNIGCNTRKLVLGVSDIMSETQTSLLSYRD